MPRMNTEIAHLEELLEQLISLHRTSQSESRTVRARLAAVEAENRVLGEKLRSVSERLSALLEKMPQAEEG